MSKQRDSILAIFDENQIKSMAEDAAYIAKSILQIGWIDHSITLIDKPRIKYDALINLQTNEIQINLGKLKPLPENCFKNTCTVKYRLLLAIYEDVYHEVRHSYQKLAIQAYYEEWPFQFENKETCMLWLKDLNTEKSEICEADANDFAYYLVHRFPIRKPMVTRNRKLNRLKKRYDMIDLPAK